MSETINMKTHEAVGTWLWRVWSTYPFRLLGYNMLFLLSCLPIITIPASYCALHAVIQRYYRKMQGDNLIKVYFYELGDAFWKRSGICWGILLGTFLLIRFLMVNLGGVVGSSIAAVVVLCALIILSWFCAQTVYLNLNSMYALRNSLIFIIIETTRNFGIITVWSICLTVLSWGWPISGFLLIVLPVLQITILTGLILPAIQDYLVID